MKFKHLLVMALASMWTLCSNAAEVPYNVGSQDTPGTYLVTNSDTYQIKDGDSWNFVFTNYNNVGNNWNNWLLGANNGEGKNYFLLRNDNWEDVAGSNTGCVSNFNWDNFPAQMNGSVVDMTVSRSGNTISVSSKITTTASAEYSYSYTYTGELVSSVGLFFSTNESWMTITKAEYTPAPEVAPNITSIPYSANFDTSIIPFDAGTVKSGTKIQNVLNVNNTTATAWFDTDSETEGNQPYELADNEEVTVTFTAYHGWLSSGKDQGVKLINSDGVEIASYYYTLGSCQISNVKIGNATVSDFAAFGCQSWCATSGKNANGLTNNPYNVGDANNTIITINMAKSGKVSINFKNGHFNVDKTYRGTLADDAKKDIAKIVVFSGSNNEDRTICIDNLNITSEIKTTPKADFTIKYVDENGTEIKESTTGNDEVGSNPVLIGTDKEAVINGDIKYIYESDDAASQTIAEDGSTIVTVRFTATSKINYIVKNSLGNTLTTGAVFTGESATVAVPRYVNVEGTLYETVRNGNDWYHHTYTINTDNQEETVTYNATEINKIVYYAEAEDLAGAIAGGGNSTRTSMGLTAYGTNLPVTTLSAGTYKIYMHAANGNSASRAVAFKNGETSVADFTIVNNNNNQDLVSEEFIITSDANITLTSEGSSASGVDFFYIQKTGEASIARTTATEKYGTICAPFAATATGATVYSAAINGESVTLAEVGTELEAGVPYIYQATADAQTFTCTGASVAAPATACPLTGVFAATEVPVGSYVMQTLEGVQAFYIVEAGAQPTLSAYKAYLSVPSSAKSLKIGFGEETAIKAIDALTNGAAKIYDVNGRELKSLQKGVNIVNGVKVLVK